MGHEALAIAPLDEHNLRLLANVRPDGWKNPTPAPRYNMVVIGAGTAGLVTAAGAAGLGAKVALIERDLMGGDCLNFGCVPSKALIASSRVAASARDAKRFGVIVPEGVRVDFPAVMARMRALRADLVEAGFGRALPEPRRRCVPRRGAIHRPRQRRSRGRDVALRARNHRDGSPRGCAADSGPRRGRLSHQRDGFLADRAASTAEVIGAGPIGCELAQAFRRFGAEVTLLEVMPQILTREDRDAAKLIESALIRDGVRIVTNCKISRVEKRGAAKVLVTGSEAGREEIAADEILIGAGRAPNIEDLKLEAAGVESDRNTGIKVNDYLQTANPHIYAIGDVCLPLQIHPRRPTSTRVSRFAMRCFSAARKRAR